MTYPSTVVEAPHNQTDLQCPVEHTTLSARRMPFEQNDDDLPIMQDAQGVWHVRDYEIAKKIMRGQKTRQAGFGSELVRELPDAFMKNEPVLYQDGAEHKAQRRELARFFTPKATSSNYRRLMERYAHEMLAELYEEGRVELSDLTMKMAVEVAAQVVGLTSSMLPGMAQRIDAFIQQTDLEGAMTEFRWEPKVMLNHLRNQTRIGKFYFLDVKPAIIKRKRKPQDDVISHLIAQDYSDSEIMIECITYGTAGMVTTREFIVFATWHMLENAALRQQYLAADEADRYQILEEILRVEPVVSHLFRRTTEPIAATDAVTIPADALVDLHIYAINTDESVVGAQPTAVCPMRELPRGVLPPMMSFGDGHHRCPGAYLAIQEADIFLHKLLAIPNLKLVSEPVIRYKEIIKGYETRNFMVAVDEV
jgi:cytochrome P450